MQKKNKTVSARLPETLRRRLEERLEQTGEFASHLLTKALEEYLDRQERK